MNGNVKPKRGPSASLAATTRNRSGDHHGEPLEHRQRYLTFLGFLVCANEQRKIQHTLFIRPLICGLDVCSARSRSNIKSLPDGPRPNVPPLQFIEQLGGTAIKKGQFWYTVALSSRASSLHTNCVSCRSSAVSIDRSSKTNGSADARKYYIYKYNFF